ncbi:hypothetical protein Misp01_70410 [Microtetraspora sp. NBRC 13810]|uniref:hypothetical protein n=1 Tax=Microtetraspora sp. NBRC 13810 TaxID=3030990 RepID=UPI0024A30941|nr:hypothetical protein [Microtetraspora sp. NBRC 13810]GLW11913.1 hypothetical protein Misp01_70410 [Microtetraspora sp. NBRC 13810]
MSIGSPTNQTGFQHTSSSSPGGATGIQNALCRGSKVCNINQKVIFITPDTAQQATQNATAYDVNTEDVTVPEVAGDSSSAPEEGSYGPQDGSYQPAEGETYWAPEEKSDEESSGFKATQLWQLDEAGEWTMTRDVSPLKPDDLKAVFGAPGFPGARDDEGDFIPLLGALR